MVYLMQYLEYNYTKNVSIVYLKFRLNWTSVFYQAALLRVSICC